MSNPEVLIIGAGPTGLAAALMLTHLGVKVRIIDKNEGRSIHSKAMGVQAGTLECLKSALGPELPKTMVTQGCPAQESWLHLDKHPPLRLDMASIESEFNYVLILEQSETERIFEEHLSRQGVIVERDLELLSLEEKGSHVHSTLKPKTGKIQNVDSAFVIGCDGAHSTVRHILDFPFDGAPYRGDFILGDAKIDWREKYGSVHVFTSGRGSIACFPFKEDKLYRLVLVPKVKEPTDAKVEISLDEFRNILSFLSEASINITEPRWLTRFSVHHRMVKHFQRGRVFLAGDAAHIHSPVGGQGMNIGIQDALNISQKLKRVLKDHESLKILSLYEQERIPVAKRVLKNTHMAFNLALLPEIFLVKWARKNIFPKIIGSPWVQKRIVDTISEVSDAKKEIQRYSMEKTHS